MSQPTSSSPRFSEISTCVADDAYVLPAAITAEHSDRGPRFGDDVWDVRSFVPRTTSATRIDFTTLHDLDSRRTAKEYLYSRIHRGIPANQCAGTARPMKITGLAWEFNEVRVILAGLARAGAPHLAEVTREHLDEVLAAWKHCPDTAAGLVGVVKHMAAHGEFLTDRLVITPWPGRPANLVAGRLYARENATPRIPEHITAPLLQAALFYVETASANLIAGHAELAALEAARAAHHHGSDCTRAALENFVERRRCAGRGLPAIPSAAASCHRDAPVLDGVVQAPNESLVGLLAGVHRTRGHRKLLAAAGAALGYEQGGLDTSMSPWPATGMPWRPRLDPFSLNAEVSHLRSACWIVIAYLSGMRDSEVRELSRDCAVTELGADGRTRHKLRGRVFKDRRLAGDEADWVVLDVVHQAVGVLLSINGDPSHLFGHSIGRRGGLLTSMPVRLNCFAAHANELFSTPETPFLPGYRDAEEARPWAFTTRQFRRTLAWHIAHQPFGVVAGARQYKHAQVAVFEGYAGTSASGFAAEVEAEQAVARLDYVEDLYRDWARGGDSGGGAAGGIDAEFARIRAELSDLPGTVADRARLRRMLEHLTTTLHPGVLGDCFYRPETALCAKRTTVPDRPLPMLDTCLSCPNSRRSSMHLPRLTRARQQACEILAEASTRPTLPLQRIALTGHLNALDRLIGQVTGGTQRDMPA
ncbi:MAG: hypothetical protein M0Z42_16925 [Actinomycetota bacterium]|jgi:hypothetical protein|nr:hypothetical protein [Actinomycetota bacterium]